MDTIGKRIQALRTARGWSQTVAADRLGITQPSLSQLENGISKSLAGETLARMCQEYHSTAEYIYFGMDVDDDPELPMIQAELLFMLRGMTQDRRSALLDSARGMYNAQSTASKNNPYPHSVAPGQAAPAQAPDSSPAELAERRSRRGMSGGVKMIGNVSAPKGSKHGNSDQHSRVPDKKHSRDS